MNRREWLKRFGGTGLALAAAPFLPGCRGEPAAGEIVRPGVLADGAARARVAFVKTRDRAEGVRRALELLGPGDVFRDRSVFVKPNYNSADEAPGSTHNDVLRTLLEELRERGAKKLTIGDRSGMGETAAVLREKDVPAIARAARADTVVFDELREEDWQAFRFKDSSWQKGFALPKPVLAADAVVSLCCLKTHRYGGHFTLSLKNSVGLAAKRVPNNDYNFMRELHSSPDQRRMIAEINAAYRPALVVLDGVEAFTEGGPAQGKKVFAEVVLAGTDRIAVDAVGVALLRHFGTTPEVEKGRIFEQEQIARAVGLGLGIDRPDRIEFLTDDRESAAYAETIRKRLA